jgi:hypothetical protein
VLNLKKLSFLVLGTAFSLLATLPARSQLIETISVSSIGHTFLSLQPGAALYVRDYLVSDDPSKGGGGATTPFTADLDLLGQMAIKVQAEPGKQFAVNVPAGEEARLFFHMYFGGSASGPGITPTMNITYENLVGTDPGFDNTSYISDDNGTVGFSGSSNPFYSSIAFTSMTITLSFPARSVGAGSLTYPIDGIDNHLAFRFTSASQTTDPGPSVSLVPVPEPDAYESLFGLLALGQVILLHRKVSKAA